MKRTQHLACSWNEHRNEHHIQGKSRRAKGNADVIRVSSGLTQSVGIQKCRMTQDSEKGS